MSLEIAAAAATASVIGTAISAALSLLAKRRGVILAANERQAKRDLKSETRLSEIESLLSEEETRKSLYRYAAAFLIFAQFVVGGLLASSFIAKNLNETIVGILGLVVLASSLVSQHFRPDLLHKLTTQKVHRLRTLKRWPEDQLYELSRGELNEDKLLEIRKQITHTLCQIVEAELEFVEANHEKTA
ncbi:MAG: hypothetical protein EBS05_08470 [Proteobacteria bacterium]|nr:hypothetical protein [Pseudomonadota bacterium]